MNSASQIFKQMMKACFLQAKFSKSTGEAEATERRMACYLIL